MDILAPFAVIVSTSGVQYQTAIVYCFGVTCLVEKIVQIHREMINSIFLQRSVCDNLSDF